jgi:perosamine synthetase
MDISKKKYYWAEPSIGIEEKKALESVIDSTWIGGNGPKVREFERQFAYYVGSKYAIAVNNGTSALLCAMQSLRGRMSYHVTATVPTYTFIATANTALEIFGGIDLIDCYYSTLNIDIDKIGHESQLIIPVDVGGLPCDYDRLYEERDAFILEDAAEAVGSQYKGKRIGSIADITTFSFHAAKVMTTGEGGMITTDNKGLYTSMKSIVNQGYGKKKHSWEYEHPVVGFNYRMAEPQAAIGIEQLKKLPEFLYKRSRFANIYRELLGEYCHPSIGRYIRFQQCNFEYDYYNSNFLFVVFVNQSIRDMLCQKLIDNGVGVKVTWKPVHQQIPYQQYYSGHTNKEWKVADRMAKQVISLPIHNCLEEDDIVEICNRFRKCYYELV